jgi:hypothetical protein
MNLTSQILWNTAKAVLLKKFMNAQIKKDIISTLMMYLNIPQQEEQAKP